MARSYYTGQRATTRLPSSRVRVYTRDDAQGIWMELRWTTTPSGRPKAVQLDPTWTWEVACAAADEVAAKRRRALLEGRESVEGAERRDVTLSYLVDRYKASEAANRWSKKHRRDVELSMGFWLSAIGGDRTVDSLTPDEVERLAGQEGRRREVSARWVRKRIKHLRAATRWGRRKARLFRHDPLDGVELPDYRPDTDHLIYSEEETAALLKPRPEVDWRVTLLANIAADTGRRLGSILSLRSEDVESDGERVFLHFRREYDKGGRGARVPISLPTIALLTEALEHELIQEWGWLFPEGRLDYDDARDKPLGAEAAIDGLHAAELVCEIPSVRGRAFHGLKRRHVTSAMEVAHGDAALVGDVTGNVSADLLRRVYRKQNRSRQTSHVDAVRKAIEGGRSDGASDSEETREETQRQDPENDDPGTT